MNFLLNLAKKWGHLWVPRVCVGCETSLDRPDKGICSACALLIQAPTFACEKCAAARMTLTAPCLECFAKNSCIRATYVLGNYAPPINHWVLALKHRAQLIYGRLMGELLADKLINQDCSVDYVLPMPLYLARAQSRGFNQALEIARPISKKLDIPILLKGVSRSRKTLAQAKLSLNQRKINIMQAFTVSLDLSGKSIAIIDDVVTTGETSEALAKVLIEAGVQDVQLWCVAKTQLGDAFQAKP